MTVSPTAFQRLLGADFARLPAPVRRVHGLDAPLTLAGRADVRVAPGWAAWLLCLISGLPRAGRDVPVEVRFVPDGGGERWSRTFDKRRYASRIDAAGPHLRERFGPFDLFYDLAVTDGLHWTLVRWHLLGVALPRFTLPRIDCIEGADGEAFSFDIDVAFPLVGPVIRYRGKLTGAPPPAGR
ncbi:MAG: DUF4166 domain-containing protein [Alphaproteobacteria bacterium]